MSELNHLNQILSANKLINILPNITEDSYYFFKSMDNSISYLAWGKFQTVSKITDTPLFVLGDFEGNHQYIEPENYIFIYNDKIISQYNQIFKTSADVKTSNQTFDLINKNETPLKQEWIKMVTDAVKLMTDKIINKVVLSRKVKLVFESFNINNFLKTLLEANNYAFNSYFITYKNDSNLFVSLTPEQLFKINSKTITTMSLAGSMPEGSNEIEAKFNEDLLINSHKLIDEHLIVSEEIAKRLKGFCKNFTQSPLKIMKLNYIQHRMHLFEGSIDPAVSVFDILEIMHPTPAVGGTPNKLARKVILDLEKEKRQFYAAPFGIIAQDVSEIAVGLRSASYHDKTLTIYAGCGITKESDPELEWDETANKMRPFLKIFKESFDE